MVKDDWDKLSDTQKIDEVTKALRELQQISSKKHLLYGTRVEGKLSDIRVNLEKFILNTADWEEEKEKNHD